MRRWGLITVYFAAFCLTYGYGYNRCEGGFIGSGDRDDGNRCAATVMSPVWPFYWSIRAGIALTEPSP